MNWLKKKLTVDLYVQIERNKFRLKLLNSDRNDFSVIKEFTPSAVFTTERLLVGHFREAESCLSTAVADVVGKSKLCGVRVVVHPMTMIEGGLCEVEERVFKELTLGAGAFKVITHCGEELTANRVLEKFS